MVNGKNNYAKDRPLCHRKTTSLNLIFLGSLSILCLITTSFKAPWVWLEQGVTFPPYSEMALAVVQESQQQQQDDQPVKTGRLVTSTKGGSEHRMDVLCTLQRYPHLEGRFCDPIDRLKNCSFQEFESHYRQATSMQYEWGCPLDEAICYAHRYPDLFQAFCMNQTYAECDYYQLRRHYETAGLYERRVWGCDVTKSLPLAVEPISEQHPFVTVNKLAHYSNKKNIFGNATMEMFQGSWEPVEWSEINVSTAPTCPRRTSFAGRFCNLTARQGSFQPAKYVAPGLPEWDSEKFRNALRERDLRIAFVGDSIIFQLYNEILCLSEADDKYFKGLSYHQVFLAPFPRSVTERVETRTLEDDMARVAFQLQWVDEVIASKATHVVYNTGPWWNPHHFKFRGEWCDYEEWGELTYEDTMAIYMETMEQTILPILTSLVQDHGIMPIWQDVAPGGKFNMTTGEHFDVNPYTPYYKMFPLMNEVGRRITIQAGGWVLPIWDLSMPRWQEHVYHDNNEFQGGDQLHWCSAYGNNAVPVVWARLLSQAVIGEKMLTGTDGEATVAVSKSRRLDQQDSSNVPAHEKNNNDTFTKEESKPFVRLGASHTSACSCSQATNAIQCRANIMCLWNHETGVCSEHNTVQ